MKVLTVKETAEQLGVSEQNIRCGLRAGKYPFGVAFKRNPNNKSYEYKIFDVYLEKFKKGELSLLPMEVKQ